MESRRRHQSRSLPLIKQKSGISHSGVALGRLFLSAKVCTSCVQPLGLFLSRGSNCPKCGLRVCKKCKVYQDAGPNWICLVCSKESPNFVKALSVPPRPGNNGIKYGTNSYSNIKRSWSISATNTNRGSPVLKAYTKYNIDDRGYNSLPRMSTTEAQAIVELRHDHRIQHYGGGQSPAHYSDSGRRHFSTRNHPHSTLHPYMNPHRQGSPTSSINFIEDEYWDYYDYEIDQSEDERSSCERSLGDTLEYSYHHQFDEDEPPKKPKRTKKVARSKSVGSYDTKMYTVKVDLNSYSAVSPGLVHTPVYNSLPIKNHHTAATNENIVTGTSPRPRRSLPPPERPLRRRASNEFDSFSLPPRRDNKELHRTTSSFSTLPKEWKIFKRSDNNTTTIVISGGDSSPIPTSTLVPSTPPLFKKEHLSRTYITDATKSTIMPLSMPPPVQRKFPVKEPFPSFPSKMQPFIEKCLVTREIHMHPLLPLYQGRDHRRGLFALSKGKLDHPISLSANDAFRNNREVIIPIEREEPQEALSSTTTAKTSLNVNTISSTMEPVVTDDPATPRRSEKSLWTICDAMDIEGSESGPSDNEDDAGSDSSFQSVVNNNRERNNGFWNVEVEGVVGGAHAVVDVVDNTREKPLVETDEVFESCQELSSSSSAGEEDNEELEQIRRLLLHRCVPPDSHQQNQPSAKKEPVKDYLQVPNSSSEGLTDHDHKVGSENWAQNDDTMSVRQESRATDDFSEDHDHQHRASSEDSAGMNSDSPSTILRKFKSRVLIGLDETTAVKVSGEVDIVTGQGSTFVRDVFSEVGTYPCRESPEGEESGSDEQRSVLDQDSASEKCVHTPSRSEPDGADAEKSSDDDGHSTPVLEMNSEDAKSESTDSWTEEVGFADDPELPAPLDMTLHTICEESETESEYRKTTPIAADSEGLERYFDFAGVDTGIKSQTGHGTGDESEFSDTFSESSVCSGLLRRQDSAGDLRHLGETADGEDAVDLASGRLEKYFQNLGVGLSQDSDSVGSESETGHGLLMEKKKKVLKHHKRSAEYEEEHFVVSEDDDCAFEQEGFDTIKKQRKLRKSQEDLLSSQRKSSSDTIPEERNMSNNGGDSNSKEPLLAFNPNVSTIPLALLPPTDSSPGNLKRVTVSRSNSFNWSSDEEVNLMMRSLRSLIKNMTLNKKQEEGKGEKLTYLENELIRLMKTEGVKTMVDTSSSSSEPQSENGQPDVIKLMEHTEGDSEPELLAKVMTHVGQRLSTWMKDEEKDKEDVTMTSGPTIKTAQSISSDLNDDLESDTRFSWKGSFESTLAKRQSVGSSDSLDYYAPVQTEGQEVFVDRSILRSSSLHHLAHSQPILEESESLTSSLPRLNPAITTKSADPARPVSARGQAMTKSKSLYLDSSQREVKSARYRPPGYSEISHTLDRDVHASTPLLSQRRDRFLLPTCDVKEVPKGFAVRGLMEFSMQYNYKMATFEVTIKQCRDLAAVDVKKGRSDPYVKGYLLPDRSKSNKRKTKTKKNTLNPVFGETLKFPISLEELESRTLSLSVWHSDMFGKNEFMGQVSLGLKGRTFDDSQYQWYPLNEERAHLPVDQSISNGIDLILALKWTPRGFNRDRGNLSVLFKEAKGLKLVKNSIPSTFIKCSPINERSKKQKTGLAKRTTNPVWNATMTFDNVGRDGLEVTLCSSNGLNGHESIGKIDLNCDFELWRHMEKRDGFWVEGIVQLRTNY